MSPLLPQECPNCGRLHDHADFNTDPGPIQRDRDRLAMTVEHVLRYGKVGRQTGGRLRDVLQASKWRKP